MLGQGLPRPDAQRMAGLQGSVVDGQGAFEEPPGLEHPVCEAWSRAGRIVTYSKFYLIYGRWIIRGGGPGLVRCCSGSAGPRTVDDDEEEPEGR